MSRSSGNPKSTSQLVGLVVLMHEQKLR